MMKSLEFNESHAVKYYEYIVSNIHLGRKHYYTGIINLLDWNGKNTWLLLMYIGILNKYSDIYC